MTHTIIDRLFFHAENTPGKEVYRYLERGEQVAATLAFAQLRTKAVGLSAGLLEAGHGKRDAALLLFSNPLEFVQGFLGCLAAGVTAVPVAVPSTKSVDTVANICRNARVKCILAGQREKQQLCAALEAKLGPIAWYSLDELLAYGAASSFAARPDSLPGVTSDDIAFLQYTSGSTGTPKGVMVSHGNLMANSAAIGKAMRMHRDTVFVSWLPHYHDMGLIGPMLQSIERGSETILMRPVDFVQKPVRWLQAISKFGATVSGGPNFAYDLCVDKIGEEQKVGLDLSAWEVAFSGAEPVKAATVARFADAFAPCKFKKTSIYPCYGMAESTLFISGEMAGAGPAILLFEPDTLGVGGEARLAEPGIATGVPFVSCGTAHDEARVRIVHPETRTILSENHVGEIWVRSLSVAQGYYENAEASSHAFAATIVGGNAEHYLRTGDLGTLHKGQLVILGRIKDLLIVRGRNYYPQDIEATAQEVHAAMAPGGGAVFQLSSGDGRVALVHEVAREFARQGELERVADQLAAAVREAVIERHGIALEKLVFIRPGHLPRTTSGKVRRNLCREMFERGEFASMGAAEQIDFQS